MSEDLDNFCAAFAQLNDPSDHGHFNELAGEAATTLAAEAEEIARRVGDVLLTTPSDDAASRLAKWTMIDKLCKRDEAFGAAFKTSIVELIIAAPVPRAAASALLWEGFQQVLESLKLTVDAPLVSLAKTKLLAAHSAQRTEGTRTLPNVPAMLAGRGPQHRGAGASPSTALMTQHVQSARSVGNFQVAIANNARTGAARGRLQVKTRDSFAAVKMASSYTPAAPQEIALPMPIADADAPQGYLQALPQGYNEQYTEERRKRLREVMEKQRAEHELRDAAEPGSDPAAAAGLQHSRKGGLAKPVIAEEDFSDVVMPEELPRDEYGVKMCNFPAGVRFLRECIRQCGGALELEVLSRRVSQMAEEDSSAAFGDLRFFIKVHSPTFTLNQEGMPPRWVVRVAGDPQPDLPPTAAGPSVQDPSGPRVWESFTCPLCTTVLTPGRNIARHRNCRRCVAMQIALGLKGKVTGPIAELAFAAAFIMQNEADFDDDDLLWFARAIEASGNVRRFRLATAQTFAPVLKAIRSVRDRWLRERGAKSFDGLKIFAEDRVRCIFFETLGSNINRLPIPWIETGDICDMCRRFSKQVKRPLNPPPRPGDPRIRIDSEYCGMLMCTSDTDSEDDPIDDEQEFSDEEEAGFEFAPPVTVAETIMVAGIDRDSKRLLHKLRTAPPVVVQKVLESVPGQTLQEMYNAEHNTGAVKPIDQLPSWNTLPQQGDGQARAAPPFAAGGQQRQRRTRF